jgi:cytoskeletal protein CcmA (bactofilin family)
MTIRRLMLTTLALAVAALTGTAPAAAQTTFSEDDDPIVVISGNVAVDRAQTVDGVFVVSGDAAVAGTVTGDVWVLDGDALISGTVEGDVVMASGTAELPDGALVEGDITYGDDEPAISPGATVEGEVSDENWDDAVGVLPVIGFFAFWLAVTISTLVLGIVLVMVAPRAADAVFAQAQSRLLVSIAFGLAVFVAVPVAAVVAAATLLGLPLAIAILLALLPLGAIAYVTTAWVVGRAIVKERSNRVVAFLVGLAILRLLALVPVLGLLVGFAATIVGVGLLVAALGASRVGPAPPPAPATQPAAS